MLLKGVVIGSTCAAAYYALVNGYYFVPTRKTPPVFYRRLERPLLGTAVEADAWNKVNIRLGLSSKRLSLGEQASIRVSEEQLKIVCENVTFRYEFETVYVFDPSGIVLENEVRAPHPRTFTVFDDFELSSLGPKKYELPSVTGSSGLVKEMHFYCSDRVDGANFITDCVTESELTHEQLNSFDYSDSMIRFIVKRHLTSVGVHGIFMKYYDSGKPKYRKPKVVHVRRLVFERDNNIYKDTVRVKFLNLSLKEIDEISTKG